MRIDLSEHAKEQVRIRKIDLTELVDCLSAPDDLLYDVREKTFIAVKRLNGKLLVVIYSAERQIKSRYSLQNRQVKYSRTELQKEDG